MMNIISSSESVNEDGEYWFEHQISETQTLSISTITNAAAEEVNCGFCDGFGYYLSFWERLGNGQLQQTVLAKMVSEEAAKELWGMLKRR
jgi:hypothetical protein